MTQKRRGDKRGVRAVVYDRTSVRDPESMDEHVKRCRAHCKAQGWDVVAVETDPGISGFHDRVRPGWVKVKQMVEHERVDVVVFYALSRIERSVIRTFEFAKLCEEHEVAFVSVTEQIDTSGQWGRVILSVLASTAEIESLTKRERALMGRERNAREGYWSGGRRLFGLRPVKDNGHTHLEVEQEEARHIREAATEIINGASKSAVVKMWNDAGVRTTSGNRWSPAALDFTLSNRTLVRHKILTASDQRRVVKAFDGRRTGQRPDRYFLSGLLTCAICSSPMGAMGGRYVCKATGELHLSAVASKLDTLVSRLVAEHPQRDRDELHDPANELVQEREAVVAQMWAVGEDLRIPAEALAARTQTLQRKLDAIDAKLEKMRPRSPWLEMFEEYDPAGHRLYVEQVVERVVVYPAKPSSRFEPDRVVVEWRDEKPKRRRPQDREE